MISSNWSEKYNCDCQSFEKLLNIILGESKIYFARHKCSNNLSYEMDNKISSVKADGCITLFDMYGCSGRSVDINFPRKRFSNFYFDDMVSSFSICKHSFFKNNMSILEEAHAVTFYEQAGFTGKNYFMIFITDLIYETM